jgi:hypothetical protein
MSSLATSTLMWWAGAGEQFEMVVVLESGLGAEREWERRDLGVCRFVG